MSVEIILFELFLSREIIQLVIKQNLYFVNFHKSLFR